MVGPCPFPYHVPVLADAFTLLALGHLISRIHPSRPMAQSPRHSGARTFERTAP
ncbi:hypothetical protein SALBM311S_01107 [Streptomyces alboniger]